LKPTVSIVVPVFDESRNIEPLVRRVVAACSTLENAWELLLVDDGSRDDSGEKLEAAARAHPGRIRAIFLNRNYGQHAAIMCGFARARGDMVITLDADLQNPPEEIPRLVEQMVDEGWDFLSASRFPLVDPRAMHLTNRLGNAVLTIAAAVLFFKPIRDSQSGMWVFRRRGLERMRLTSDGMAFSEEIKLEALLCGLRFGEGHIPYGERIGEVKLQKWRDGYENLMFLVRKRFGAV